MLVRKEFDFDIRNDCWGGAKDRIDSLQPDMIDTIESYLEDSDFWSDTPTDTQVNDFIWFDDDTYAEWLGFNDAGQLWDYCEALNNGIDEEDVWFDPNDRVVSSDDIDERFNKAIANEEIDEDDYGNWREWADDEGYYQIER